jgi:hypothetical protein
MQAPSFRAELLTLPDGLRHGRLARTPDSITSETAESPCASPLNVNRRIAVLRI